MAGLERWNAKWDNLDVDSDGEDAAAAPGADESTRKVLQGFPRAVADAITKQSNPGKQDALLALNCYLYELHDMPRQSPTLHKELLGALCDALRGLEEGGEVETLLFHLLDSLENARVSPQHVEHAMGAMALLQAGRRDPRVVQVVLRAGTKRTHEFPATCLARACWAAAALGNSEAAAAFLHSAMPLVEKQAANFGAADVGLLAWACAVMRPPGAWSALKVLMASAVLPAPDSTDGRVTAWSLEYLGFNACALFGLPPMSVPSELAQSLHQRLQALGWQDGTEVLHSGNLPVVGVSDLVVPDEARALVEAGRGGWSWPAAPLGGDPSRHAPHAVVLQKPAGPPLPVVQRVCRRAAALLGLPESHCETPQLLRHLHGQPEEPHVDYFSHDDRNRGLLYLGGQRVASIMIDLNDLPEGSGGDSVFPKLGVSAPAKLGRALIWPNIRRDGAVEERTLHATAPIHRESCVKHCLHFWFHAYPVQEAAAARSNEVGSGALRASGMERTPGPGTRDQLAPALETLGSGPPSGQQSSGTAPVLPEVACPPRPQASPEPDAPADAAAVPQRTWRELGADLRRLAAQLDQVSDPTVRAEVLGRLKTGRLKSRRVADLAVAKDLGVLKPVQCMPGCLGAASAFNAGAEEAVFDSVD